MYNIKTYLLVFFCILLTQLSNAQTTDSLQQVGVSSSINDIIQLKPDGSIVQTKVTIANLTETNIYEAPNIISILTEEDIKNLGYRDLLDVLNTIPGVNIANDVQNGTSIGMRGIWTEEGKVQFMLNGLVMNDMAYGSIILGHRFALTNIKRIEIIRGAGSSIYGGLAALGAINIITKTGQEINGHSLNLAGGLSNGATSRGLINYNYGGALIKGIELTASGLVNIGNASNEKRTQPDSTLVNFKDSSLVNNVQVMFRLKYKNLVFKHVYEDYNFQATFEPIASLVRTAISNFTYNFKFKNINIAPFIDSKWQLPWNTQYGDPTIYDKQNLITKRQILGLNGGYKPLKWLNFVFGTQVYNDNYRYHRKSLALSNGKFVQSYNGAVVYTEAVFISKYANATLGGRFDKYAYFEPELLPRISITKSFTKWHYKLLYGKAFKIPPLQNINLDVTGNLVPEEITDMQAEMGLHHKLVDVTATVFNTTIQNLIVFGYDALQNESYVNSGNVHTQGFELEYKLKLNKFTLKGNYSNYNLVASTANEIVVDTLNLKLGTLAFPKHKIVTMLAYKINTKHTLCANYIYQAKKYAYERINTYTDEYALSTFAPTHKLNISYQRNGLFNKLLDINVGVYNVLNTTEHYAYSFNQGYAPMLGMGRELFINFKFNL